MRKILYAALAIVVTSSGSARGGRELEGIACRSVHLQFPGTGTAFYNEVAVRKSAEGTYFMVCGWDKGYFGIQELRNGEKVIIFSVWDSGQNNPKAVDEEKRTKTVHKHPDVRIGRFGGEGTGSDIENSGTGLWGHIRVPPAGDTKPPVELPSILQTVIDQ